MAVILIGIDDTDNETSPGTGRLARNVSKECQKRGMNALGVTRHQFFVSPEIPYTSHNSGACVAIETDCHPDELRHLFDYVADESAKGSDPGVCVAYSDAVTQSMIDFANRATNTVVTMEDAFDLARTPGVRLFGLGGTCLGIIGAMSSVSLRAEGNQGRFIDLPGLRELNGCVHAQDYAKIGILLEHRVNGRKPVATDMYDTLDWVRPGLKKNRAVLVVEWSEQKNAWIPVDRKKSRPLE